MKSKKIISTFLSLVMVIASGAIIPAGAADNTQVTYDTTEAFDVSTYDYTDATATPDVTAAPDATATPDVTEEPSVTENPQSGYSDVVPTPSAKYDFEDGTDGATLSGTTSVVSDGAKESKVLYVNTDGYMTIPMITDDDGNPIETYTVSFDVKNNTTGNYFTFAASDGQRRKTGSNYVGIKAANNILISTSDTSASEKKTTVSAGTTVQGVWTHFDVVVLNGTTQVYADKTLVGELEGYTMAEINPTVLTFGLSPWSADNYADAYYDNIIVYSAALSHTALVEAGEDNWRDEVQSDHLLFGINFNNETAQAYKGTAVINGTLGFGYGDDLSSAAKFENASDTYIEAKKSDGTSLLTGLDAFTVSYRTKTGTDNTSWWLYAAPDTAAPTYGYEKYIGMFYNYSKQQLTAERYYNTSGSRSDSVSYSYTDGGWHTVDLVVGKESTEIYVDGGFVDSVESSVGVSELMGEDSIFYIGKSMWGEYATGLVDDYEVYDFAPEVSVEKKVTTDKLDIPTADADEDGYSITWESSDTSLIENDGTVHRPETGKEEVTLTAVIEYGNRTLTRTFDLIVCGIEYSDFVLDISDEKGVDIQDNMYGLFFEDINYAADGGLYAEMIENRSFEQLTTNKKTGTGDYYANPSYAWTMENGSASYLTEGGLNDNNKTYLEFTGTSFKNQAYEGMYIENGKKYKVSFWAKSSGYTGAVNVKAGDALSGTVTDSVTSEWKKYETELTATGDASKTPFTVELASSGTVDFDMISVIPSDAVMGVFRKDLVEKLKALNPGFLRFPGGCIIEGYNLKDRYQWKNSVGAVEERVQTWNRWAADTGYTNYNQTLGIGYYEYFELCEYLECDPVPVQNVGMACEYQGGSKGGANVQIYEDGTTDYTEEFYAYIQDALDLIEFANSTDFENSEWARLRRDMGHEEPFNLEMIGIGNEQWAIDGNDWYTRYEAFETEIHKRYPDIKLIGTSGPSKDGTAFDSAWSWIRENQAANDNFVHAVDEHYYVATDWFYENDDRYDDYDRGTKVFAGEYAAWTSLESDGTEGKRNNLDSALAEASFMTGLERNADVVYMASYAPLFARLNYVQWSPDMIWFDDAESFVTPDYWVQQMYMNNSGDYTLKSTVTENLDKVYQTVSFDEETGDVIIKLVNPSDEELKVEIDLDENIDITGEGTVETLKGSGLKDCNSIDEPEKITPETESIDNVASVYVHNVPAYAFEVIRINTNDGTGDETLRIDKVSTSRTALNYTLKVGDGFDFDDYDIYTAVYDDDGVLVNVKKNAVSGTADIGESGEYTVKTMVWYKDTMKPSDILPDERTVSIVTEDADITTQSVEVSKSTAEDGELTLTYGTDADEASFSFGNKEKIMIE